MNLQLFLYRSAELSDELLNVRTPDYCSARDNLVSTSLRGREGEEGGEKGGRWGGEGRRRDMKRGRMLVKRGKSRGEAKRGGGRGEERG